MGAHAYATQTCIQRHGILSIQIVVDRDIARSCAALLDVDFARITVTRSAGGLVHADLVGGIFKLEIRAVEVFDRERRISTLSACAVVCVLEAKLDIKV